MICRRSLIWPYYQCLLTWSTVNSHFAQSKCHIHIEIISKCLNDLFGTSVLRNQTPSRPLTSNGQIDDNKNHNESKHITDTQYGNLRILLSFLFFYVKSIICSSEASELQTVSKTTSVASKCWLKRTDIYGLQSDK